MKMTVTPLEEMWEKEERELAEMKRTVIVDSCRMPIWELWRLQICQWIKEQKENA